MMAAGPLPSGVVPWPGYRPYDIDSLFGSLEVHDQYVENDPTLGNLFKESSFVIHLTLGGALSGSGLNKFILRKLSKAGKIAFHDVMLAKNILECGDAERGVSVLVNAIPERVSVVILVDEYDKAILDDLQRNDLAAVNAGLMALKSLMMSSKAEYRNRIRKFIVTGSTRIAWTSLFSGANNFTYVTHNPVLCDIVGFSDKDVKDLIAAVDDDNPLKRDPEGTFKHLKDWYNGYCFDGTQTVSTPSVFCRA
jgi:hypothetical protein